MVSVRAIQERRTAVQVPLMGVGFLQVFQLPQSPETSGSGHLNTLTLGVNESVNGCRFNSQG